MTWSIPVWLDLWLVGIAGGTYSVAAFIDRVGRRKGAALLGRVAPLAILMVMAGVAFLVSDLGNPLRSWRFVTTFNLPSPMSVGVWSLTAWIVTALSLEVLRRIGRRLPGTVADRVPALIGFLTWAGLAFAVLLLSYGSVLPAVTSRTLWADSVFYPALFTASDVSMGLAVVIIAATLFSPAVGQTTTAERGAVMGRIRADLAAVNVLAIMVEIVALILTLGIPADTGSGAGEAITRVLTGNLALLFWAGGVFAALLVPLALYLLTWRNSGVSLRSRYMAVAASVCAILGGFALRSVIMIGGQTV